MLYIGIDTGVNTGFAVWDSRAAAFLEVATLPIHRALSKVASYKEAADGKHEGLVVIFEDARKRRWIPNSGDLRTEMGRRQGAGSVKRDGKIWEDFCEDLQISYTKDPPRKGLTKWDAKTFAQITKFKGRTSNHARDAALLVFGR